jgi:hypothetical protein
MFPLLPWVSCWYKLKAKVLFPLTSAASWLAVVSGVVILDSLDCATSKDTGSGVVVACEVVTGVVITGVVVVVVVAVFVHPAAPSSMIAANSVKIIFFILKPHSFVMFATIITFENEKG